MKKILIVLLILLLTGCARTDVVVKEFKPDSTIHFSRFAALPDTADPGAFAVYLEKGDTFPLKLTFKSDFIDFEEKKVNMVVKERVYFYIQMPTDMTKEKREWFMGLDREAITGMSESERQNLIKDFMIFVSRDGLHWGAYNDLGTIKGLFGISGGSLSLGMGMDRKDGIWSDLNIELLKQP